MQANFQLLSSLLLTLTHLSFAHNYSGAFSLNWMNSYLYTHTHIDTHAWAICNGFVRYFYLATTKQMNPHFIMLFKFNAWPLISVSVNMNGLPFVTAQAHSKNPQKPLCCALNGMDKYLSLPRSSIYTQSQMRTIPP